MSVPQQSPALPWGAGQQAAQEKQDHAAAGEADDVRAVSLDQLGLSLGDRIEVGQGWFSTAGLTGT
jgi:predicted lysophospholipase L1 biosynthesis ABC-type transport system permease subunit